MNRPEPDSPAAEARSVAAAQWLVRRDRGLSAAEQDEFLQWLAADPRHGDWFALHRHTVGDFAALAQWRPEHSEEPNPDLLAPPRPRVSRFALPLLAAAAAVALVIVWLRTGPAAESRAPVASAEVERRILADGSSVELNRGAVVSVSFTATERRATLVRGEAHFTVAKNPTRPFIVQAGSVHVRAVGTAFSVRLDAAAVDVLVTEGTVALAPNVVAGSVAPALPSSDAPLVTAGQRATVSLDAAVPPQITPVASQALVQHLNWQPQLLDFSAAPLGAAVAEFNRRNRVQFVLADPELAATPIVASIRSDNIEGFARFLAATPGLHIDRRSDTEIIVRRKP